MTRPAPPLPTTVAGHPVLPEPLTRSEVARRRPYTCSDGVKRVAVYRGVPPVAGTEALEDQTAYAPSREYWIRTDRDVVREARKRVVGREYDFLPVLQNGGIVVALVKAEEQR